MIELTRRVGDHHGKGKQAHVPKDVLDVLGVEPGDRLRFVASEDGCILTVVDADRDRPTATWG